MSNLTCNFKETTTMLHTAAKAHLSFGFYLPDHTSPSWAEKPEWMNTDNAAERGTNLIKEHSPHLDVAVVPASKDRLRLVRWEEEIIGNDTDLHVGALHTSDTDWEDLHAAAEILRLDSSHMTPSWVLWAEKV